MCVAVSGIYDIHNTHNTSPLGLRAFARAGTFCLVFFVLYLISLLGLKVGTLCRGHNFCCSACQAIVCKYCASPLFATCLSGYVFPHFAARGSNMLQLVIVWPSMF